MTTARNLIEDLLAQGETRASIARIIGRDSSIISAILKSDSPGRGATYIPILRDVRDTGATTRTVSYATKKDGTPRKVRGKKGQPSRLPKQKRNTTRRSKKTAATKPPGAPSVKSLITSLQERGMTLTEIGKEIGRSRSVISGIRNSSNNNAGEPHRSALTQLLTDGYVSTPTPYPTTADGTPRKVRGPGGVSIEPVLTAERIGHTLVHDHKREDEDAYERTMFYYPGHARELTISTPPWDGAARDGGQIELRDHLVSLSKGQRGQTKRVRITVTTASGDTISLGDKSGYRASDFNDILRNDPSPFAAIQREIQKVAKNRMGDSPKEVDFEKDPVVSVKVYSWATVKRKKHERMF